jgi:hypothetical protein
MQTVLIVLFAAACATSNTQEPRRTVAPATAQTSDAPSAMPYAANPILSVYVQGPDPDRGEAPDRYHASVVVTNTGDDPVDIAQATIHFEVGQEGGPFTPCNDRGEDEVASPESLGPHAAHTYVASVHCPFPTPGRYEVRTYLRFAAEAEGYDIMRHYAGSYEVLVR